MLQTIKNYQMKKVILGLILLCAFQSSYAQMEALMSKQQAKDLLLNMYPDATFESSGRTLPTETASRKKVGEVGYSEACPNGQSGGIIGVSTCYRHTVLGIPYGAVYCLETEIVNTCTVTAN